jgi:flagellar basal-body rod protein FlgF
MDKLIFTAVSGAERLLRAQQVHANNLANMDTPASAPAWKWPATQELAASATTTATCRPCRPTPSRPAPAPCARPAARSTWRSAARVTWPCSTATTKPIPAPAKSTSTPTARCRCTAAAARRRRPDRAAAAHRGRIGTDGTVSVLTEGATTMQVIDKLRLVNAEGAELTKNEAGLIVARDGASLAADPTSPCAARARRQQRLGGRRDGRDHEPEPQFRNPDEAVPGQRQDE